jgi:hypothetical protein
VTTPLEKICRALERDAKLRGEATRGPWEASPMVPQITGINDREGDLSWWAVEARPAAERSVAIVSTEANARLIAYAGTADLGSCLRIAVEALAKATDRAPTFRDFADTDYSTCAWCREPVEKEWHSHVDDCRWLTLTAALAQIAALLPDEEER